MNKLTAAFSVLLSLGSGTVAADTTLFYDSFELGSFGSDWVPTPGPDGGLIDIRSGGAPDGLYFARIGRSSDGPYTVNTLDLYLDLSDEEQVELNYAILDYYDDTQQEDAIQFSDDGGATFVTVVPFNPSSWPNTWLRYPPLDVDKEAALRGLTLNDQFVIRFQQGGSGDFNTSGSEDGFYLDDVRFESFEPVYATLPFEDGFEEGDFGPSWAWAWPDETADLQQIRPETRVNVGTGYAVHSGSFGTYLGRHYDGGRITSAVDLHLNLKGNNQVELSFWLKDHYDDTDTFDGIYFSNDGGETFVKAYQLEPTRYPDNQWQQFVLDVDELAAAAGVTLTDRFVVRFQQSDGGDFNTDGDEDGMVLDDVLVTGDYVPDPGLIDIDGNGEADALTDGLLMERFLFGFAGEALIDGAVDQGCTRCSAEDIAAYILETLL